jgi:hypothetical protein
LHALLAHEGWPCARSRLLTSAGRRWVDALELDPCVRAQVEVMLTLITALEPQLELILNRRHLERVLRVYVDRYNRERPHRALKLCPPEPEGDAPSGGSEINRHDWLGGLIHEYHRAVA